jgi:hypothetical protein
MITTKSNPPEKRCFLIVGWDIHLILRSGKSPYTKVNLRRIGLKETPIKFAISNYHEVISECYETIDLRIYYPEDSKFEWWKTVYEVTDKQKFMLTRIRLGF